MNNNRTGTRKRYALIAGIAAAVLFVIVLILLLGPLSKGKRYEKKYEDAQMAFLAGEYDEALRSLDDALSLKETEEVYLLMAECHSSAGDKDLAENVLRLAKLKLGTPAIEKALSDLYDGEKPVEVPAEVETLSFGGQNIRMDTEIVSLTQKGLTDASPLTALTNLTSLTLTDNQIKDVSPIGEMTKLTYLQLAGNQISDLSPLADLPFLRSLYLDGNPISDFTPLKAIKTLTTLSLRDISISHEQLDALQKALPNCNIYCEEELVVETLTLGGETFTSDITELSLDGKGIKDISVLAKCTRLEKLDLRNNEISDLDALSGLTELRWISLWNNKIENVAALLPLEKLTYLDLDGNAITNISPLKGLVNLEELWLSDSDPKSLDALTGMTKLRRLGLKNIGLTEEDAEILCGLTSLKELVIEKNEIAAKTLDTLITALPGCGITHDEAYFEFTAGKTVYKSTDTEEIIVEGPVEGLDSLQPLQFFTKLTKLVANDNAITDLYPLEKCDDLEYLSIGNSSPAGNNHFSDLSPLSSLTGLHTLLLPNCGIYDLTALRGLHGLHELDVSGNSLSGISALSDLAAMHTLDLSFTGITDVYALSGLTSLVSLNLDGNAIDDLTPLYGLTNLSLLCINTDELTQADVDALQEALPGCTILTSGTPRAAAENH